MPTNASQLDALLTLLLPPRCLLCGLPSDVARDLCSTCTADLPRSRHACPACGVDVPAAPVEPCGRCQRRAHRFDLLHAACRYADPADLLVRMLKFDGRLAAARVLAEVMCSAERRPLADPEAPPPLLVPVPLHWTRRWRRGFDQAERISAELARLTGWPCQSGNLSRVRATRAQSGLGKSRRRRNLHQAFRAQAHLPDRVILVDDVKTTGATLDACARACRNAGAQRIEAWVFACTPGRSHEVHAG